MAKETTAEFAGSSDTISNNIPEGDQKTYEVPDRLKYKLYDRIDISVKGMDLIIGSLVIILVVLLALGIML